MSIYKEALELVQRLRNVGCTVNRLRVADVLEAYATTLRKWHAMPTNKMFLTELEIRAVKAVLAEVQRGAEKMLMRRLDEDAMDSRGGRSREVVTPGQPYDENPTVDTSCSTGTGAAFQVEPMPESRPPGKQIINPGQGYGTGGASLPVSATMGPIDETTIYEVTDAKLVAYHELCGECGGTGVVDTGGFTPWGEPIRLPCFCTDLNTIVRAPRGLFRVSKDTEEDAVGADAIGKALEQKCEVAGIGSVEVNGAGKIGSVTLTLPDLNGEIHMVEGPPKLRPMKDAPRDGSWILVFDKLGMDVGKPAGCSLLRFRKPLSTLVRPAWLDRDGDTLFFDDDPVMLGWLPMPVQK